MENCLVTKLKGTVNNNDLNVLGALNVKLNVTNATVNKSYFDIFVRDGATVKLSDPTKHIYLNNGTSYEGEHKFTEIAIAFNTHDLGVYNVIIDNLYKLRQVRSLLPDPVNMRVKLNTLDFKYCPILSSFKEAWVEGDIANLLYNKPEITEINLSGVLTEDKNDLLYGSIDSIHYCTSLEKVLIPNQANLTGNIASLGPLTHLTDFRLYSSQIEGEIESLVAGQVHAGRAEYTFASLQNLGRMTHVTYNDVALPILANNTLSWAVSGENTTISLNGSETVIHVNSDGTWTRVS